MSLNYQTYDQLVEQIIAKFRTELPSLDPTVFASWALALAKGNAALAQSIMLLVRDLEIQLFPQTATGTFLDLWGGYENLYRLQPAKAEGLITATGTAGTNIPALTEYLGTNGVLYESTTVATVSAQNQNIGDLGRVGTTGYAQMTSEHYLATGMQVTITAPSDTDWNGTYTISVLNPFTFNFTITTAPTPLVYASSDAYYDTVESTASVSVIAKTAGVDSNLSSGAVLTLTTPITNIDDDALAQAEGIYGGTSEETDEAFRSRIILSRSILEGVFTPDQIRLAALSYQGVTRVWVKKPTSPYSGTSTVPDYGECSAFVLMDEQDPITPLPAQLTAIKDIIIEDGSMPANMSESSLYVVAPTLGASGVPQDFTFDALSPDTPTMRTAVENTLTAFFEDTVEFEEDVTEASYLGAIQNTQDLETGAWISTFNLTGPTGDISISAGEIGALGDVIWSI